MSGDWKVRGDSMGPKTSRSSGAASPGTSEHVRGGNKEHTQRTDRHSGAGGTDREAGHLLCALDLPASFLA